MILDYSRDSLLTTFAIETLKDRYMIPGEASPQDAFARAAKAFADDDDHAQRLYDYCSKLWFMFSTPILSNGGTERGLPISCYLQNVEDSRKGILDHYTESGWLSSMGGGLGAYWGNVRTSGSKTSKGSMSFGVIPFQKILDALVMAFAQGGTRRASYAYYMPIDHAEIEDSITARKPTGGDPNRKLLNLHNAVCITDKFMEAVKKGKSWKLKDPHSKKVVKTVQARDLWQLILETRMSTGEPYIFFSDTVNRLRPAAYKALGLEVLASNLCSEIVLTTDHNRTAVCCLSSVNLEKFEEWRQEPKFIEDLVRMLDNVLTFFAANAPTELWRATYSVLRERSIGLGMMGFHAYLQNNDIPFEGPLAVGANLTMSTHIHEKAMAATRRLAKERGPAPDSTLEDPVRNVHVIAVAPNASTGILCNTSPSIEPLAANAFTQKTLSGSFLVKSAALERLLEKRGRNDEETWQSIIINDGSVQHLDCLDTWEKDVFKTAYELDQHWVIRHVADRTPYVCQAQSTNLFFPPDVNLKYLNSVHLMAYNEGCKTLYYLRSKALKGADKISEQIERIVRKEVDEEVCFGCQG